jgi:hypothetical protein
LDFGRDLAIYNSKKLPVPIVSRKRIHHHAGVSNMTTLPSESPSPPNIQEKALSIIQEKAKFCAGVKVIYRNGDGSIEATEIYGLGKIECQKDTGKLLALAFTPKLNATLRRIIKYERDENGKILSDGSLTIYTSAGTEGARTEGSFYAILDRTCRLCDEDTLVLCTNTCLHHRRPCLLRHCSRQGGHGQSSALPLKVT